MNSDIWAVIRRIYDEVHLALWATLAAFVLYLTFFIVPKLPEVKGQAERIRAQEIAAEHEWYCGKWGMGAGAHLHDQCIWDLQEFRSKVETRIADENNF